MGSNPLSPEESRQFVKDLEIDPPRIFRTLEKGVVNPKGLPDYKDSDQAVVIGSQIAEFAASVPSGLRAHISNSFLLAQLAAKKAIERSRGGTPERFDR